MSSVWLENFWSTTWEMESPLYSGPCCLSHRPPVHAPLKQRWNRCLSSCTLWALTCPCLFANLEKPQARDDVTISSEAFLPLLFVFNGLNVCAPQPHTNSYVEILTLKVDVMKRSCLWEVLKSWRQKIHGQHQRPYQREMWGHSKKPGALHQEQGPRQMQAPWCLIPGLCIFQIFEKYIPVVYEPLSLWSFVTEARMY